jgi:LuxR family quorum-sensing system transcriptional regulator CciR
MRISEFIEKSNAAQSPEEVFDLFAKAVGEYGYDRVLFGAATPAAQAALAKDDLKVAVALKVPEDWFKYYFEKSYGEIDPVLLLAPCRTMPFLWSDVLKNEHLSPKQKQLLQESNEAGLHNGLSIPIHGPQGESYVVSLAAQDKAESTRNDIGVLHILATQFHLAYSQIARKSVDSPAGFHLTERERECLAWAARGKSAWATSMILGVSEHTVNFHMKSAMKKMGTTNRVTAVVSAIQTGLIPL